MTQREKRHFDLYKQQFLKFKETKVPIYRGCPNEVCYCTGICQEIIGYRDRLPNEQNPFIPTPPSSNS